MKKRKPYGPRESTKTRAMLEAKRLIDKLQKTLTPIGAHANVAIVWPPTSAQ